MIAEVLSLTRWEWFKLRRRRLPWILLFVSVLLLQITFWSAYALFRVGDDVALGDGGTASVSGAFLELLAFPNNAVIGLAISHGFSIILIMILAASLTGTEYGWGTVRTVLTRGAGRWQLLASKLLLVALLGVGALIVGALSMALSSFIASLTLEGGNWLAESADWAEVARIFGKAIFGLLPYVALGLFFAVLTTSSGAAIGLSLGYAVAEGIVISILANFDWFERFSGYVLGQAVGGWLGTTGGELFAGGGDDRIRRRRGPRHAARRPAGLPGLAGLHPDPQRPGLLDLPAPRYRRRQGRVAGQPLEKRLDRHKVGGDTRCLQQRQ